MIKYDMVMVGLGNPGKKYERNRHNVGFRFLDQFAKVQKTSFVNSKFNVQLAECEIKNKRCLLVKPLTFMNASGVAVSQILNYYKIPIEKLLVVYDDISFDVGNYKLKKKGSSGGHKGINSIIEQLGTEIFDRIKIGVGKNKDVDLKNWVVSNLSNEQLNIIESLFLELNEVVKVILEESFDYAMNIFNKKNAK